MIDRVFPSIGRIRRSAGTHDLAVFDRINGTMTALYREGRHGVLVALRDRETTPLAMLAAHGEGREPHRLRRAAGIVYVVQASPSGHYKIGTTTSPDARFRELQTCNWEDLRLVLSMPGGRRLERSLHERFAASHLVREWFRPSDELEAWVLETRQLSHVTVY